ncbi:putative nuclease HARBI1 [Monomorium pharaonis]|uniref:putative nuclease HARBI1 n=1 Tax=Monomorium pharaonis TaxID=307658 RepID=UPI0017462595|nr:putative nuclease HARBI1 [Monomorium pharaonis]
MENQDLRLSESELIFTIATTFSFTIKEEDSCMSRSSSSDESDELSSDEEEDTEILYAILMVQNTRGVTIPTEKLSDYIERVVPGYLPQQFKEHFRMFPETYNMILHLIGPALSQTTIGRKQIDPGKQLLITLWFLATPDSYRSIHVQFGVGKATAFRAVRRITYALHCLAPRFIQWPKGETVRCTINEFSKIKNFPNVIGALDGSHIKIRAPKEDAASYICRKQFHAIHLQAVCNAKCVFTHCYAGHVGSVHDARVFRNSTLAHYIEVPNEYFPFDTHIVADAAYPIHPHVMVPFRDNGHLTIFQTNYNTRLSSTRMAIERAFGLLKVRFRILLDCLPLTDVKKIPQVILACCVLHNICMLRNDEFPVVIYPEENAVPDVIRAEAELGNIKRNRIMYDLRM